MSYILAATWSDEHKAELIAVFFGVDAYGVSACSDASSDGRSLKVVTAANVQSLSPVSLCF